MWENIKTGIYSLGIGMAIPAVPLGIVALIKAVPMSGTILLSTALIAMFWGFGYSILALYREW